VRHGERAGRMSSAPRSGSSSKSGHATLVPPEQRCCGALHQHAGLGEQARSLARENVAAFEATGASPDAERLPTICKVVPTTA
jgi:Fe-S oxidoreductase